MPCSVRRSPAAHAGSRGALYEPPDAKRRPVLILTREETIGVVYDLIVCPATGTIRGLATEIELGAEDGMPRSCVLNLANTTSAEKAMLTRRITTLGAAKMDEACRALATAAGCS